jgi:hypothetical protein
VFCKYNATMYILVVVQWILQKIKRNIQYLLKNVYSLYTHKHLNIAIIPMSCFFYKIVIFVKYIKYIRQSSIYKSQITRHQFSSRGKKVLGEESSFCWKHKKWWTKLKISQYNTPRPIKGILSALPLPK